MRYGRFEFWRDFRDFFGHYDIARELGQGLRKMRGAVDDIKQEIMKETEDNPVSEIKNEIDKVKQEAANLMQEEDKKTK